MKRMILCAVLALLATGTTQAADDCANASDQATMNICAGDSFKKSDKQLNELYKQIEARLKDDADTTKLLVSAQKAWISFRDAECTFSASGVAQGTAYPMIYAMCLDGLTQSRVKDLQTYLSCEEGDLSCPVPVAQ
ncbi:lysozyme inhibitor LprI family protein [Pararhizobium sp. BT-229]|uniref:lysozyme inhibitor LprI family protein n=1 Tax=Pararhizobium sp. BT-229 TaxID=2986923 RepID=UPI0021F6A092|nr:lysozyme inhibitor LprI family protein [Pararhizobium sp. BT-229]MCV9961227.1 lysozyme inhibitor LprI family protein [Pararhizobium sp. BT-229]